MFFLRIAFLCLFIAFTSCEGNSETDLGLAKRLNHAVYECAKMAHEERVYDIDVADRAFVDTDGRLFSLMMSYGDVGIFGDRDREYLPIVFCFGELGNNLVIYQLGVPNETLLVKTQDAQQKYSEFYSADYTTFRFLRTDKTFYFDRAIIQEDK